MGPRNTSLIPGLPLPGRGRGLRILIGLAIVVLFGAVRQSGWALSGPDMPWPNAALWAAAGWGLGGLAVRPMLLLIVIGLVQDTLSQAPLGSYVTVNLATFGLAALLAGRRESEGREVRQFLIALGSLIVGYGVLAGLAAMTVEATPRLLPLIGSLSVTLLLFIPLFLVFRLMPDEEHMFRGRM
jgi:hypothetical protein